MFHEQALLTALGHRDADEIAHLSESYLGKY